MARPETLPPAHATFAARPRDRWRRWLVPLAGATALAWFLIRCIPKPSRATYPCQRAAFPLAGGFVVWLLGLAGATAALGRAHRRLRETRYAVAAGCLALALVAGGVALVAQPAILARAFAPTDPPNTPVGVARGIHPGRVVWVHDPDATNHTWDPAVPATGYHWDDTNTSQAVVDSMLSRAVRWLTGEATDADAWDALFRDLNRARYGEDVGYTPGETIAVKLNLNAQTAYVDESNEADLSPQVVLALVRQLVYEAGVAPGDLVLYDSIKRVADKTYLRCAAEFPGLHFVDQQGTDGRELVQPTAAPVIAYSNGGGTDCLPQCVLDARYMINLAILKKHQLAGSTSCAKNHYGSLCRIPYSNQPSPYNLHQDLPREKHGMGRYRNLVDLMGHEHLGGKTMLFLVDGLWGGWYSQGNRSTPTKWLTVEPMVGDYPSSLFASQDGVAIESVCLDFLRTEDQRPSGGDASLPLQEDADDHLHEAALAHAPPSGTYYDPEGDGTRLASLGVHEHWNNPTDKQYTRNLGTGDGIELVSTAPNTPPGCELLAPADGAIVCYQAGCTLEADAWDPDPGDVVTEVVFYCDGTPVGVDDDGSDGWTCAWPAGVMGPHTLTAEAVDSHGVPGASGPVAVEVAYPGDANRDGTVDTADYFALSGHWYGPGGWAEGDFTGDGFVDTADYFILSGHWYETAPAP